MLFYLYRWWIAAFIKGVFSFIQMWEVSMGCYISYIIDGIWEAKQCILLGIILWLLWNLILFSLKNRSGEKLNKYGNKYLFNLTPAMGSTLLEWFFQTRPGIFKRQGDSICNFPALLLLCRSGNLCNSSFSWSVISL